VWRVVDLDRQIRDAGTADCRGGAGVPTPGDLR
jgi:hypothetical protein